MTSGPSHLLNQCMQCGMKFDNSEQLANHTKKFCVGSDFAADKLERKYQENLRLKNQPRVQSGLKASQSTANMNNAGAGNMGGYNRNFDDDYKRLYENSVQNRENDMKDELERLKKEKNDIRSIKKKEEEALADLLRDVEMKREKELRARIEKEQIKKEITSLEKTKLTTLEQEKKSQLEKLAAEREALRNKEDMLMNELTKLDRDMQTMERIREEDMAKVNEEADRFKSKLGDNRTAQDMLLHEKSDRVAELKMRREQLDLERKRIMGDLDKIKTGDATAVRRSNNYGLYAANQMLNDIKGVKNYGADAAYDKINRDRERLNDLKRSQMDTVKKEHIYPDYEYDLKRTSHGTGFDDRGFQANRPFQNNANDILGSSRDNFHKNQHLDEISTMRNKYMSTGGQDPRVMKNFENLEDFYKKQYSAGPTSGNGNKLPDELRRVVDLKEEENQKLKRELDLLKNTGGGGASFEDGPKNFALGDINLRMNGLQGGPQQNMGGGGGHHNQNHKMFNIYQAGKEFFVQNEVRSVDLNEEERAALNLNSAEVDELRLLSQLPVGTELYRFKMEQYKDQSTMRSEINKIIQEQRLQKIRRDFEKQRREEDRKYENERWVDEQRKNIIAARIRKDLQPTKTEHRYDPTEGFIIHWDYALGIPKRNDSCQVVYGIYINGDEVYAPRLIDPHPCEIDTSITNRCIFGESHHVLDIPANSNCLLVWEVQIFPNKDNPAPKLVSYGWTQLDLFDTRRELRRGKYKVPLYECPTDTNIEIEGIKFLNPVQNGVSWMYLRISYPQNDDIGKAQSIYPENTHMEYVIPQIHLRSFKPPIEAQFEKPQIEYIPRQEPPREKTPQYQPPPQQPQQYWQPPIQQPQPQYDPQPPFHDPTPKNEPEGQPNYLNIPQHQNELSQREPTPNKDPTPITKPEPNKSIDQGPYQKKGVQVIIHSIYNHVAKSHLKVSCALLDGNRIMIDENGQNCGFNTTIHNPLDFSRRDNTSMMSAKKGMSNKAQDQTIIFKEEARFLVDINRLIEKNKGRQDVYLAFQVLEKPEPVNIQTDSNTVSYKANETANYGGMEYDLFGWYLFKLNKMDGGIFTGKFMQKLFEPPLSSPPIQVDKINKLESDLEFQIEEFNYDQEDVDQAFGDGTQIAPYKEKKKGKKKKGDKSKINKTKDSSVAQSRLDKSIKPAEKSVDLKNDPYIPNTRPQYRDGAFEKGMGVDFYVDGCRFLPDNVTVVKVAVMIVNIDFDIICKAESQLPELDSPTYNPSFNFRMEIRKQYLSPTALAFISIDTIDKASNQVKIVGYSGINLFIQRFSKKQPTSNNEPDIVLLSGNYQLPIYCQEPYRTKPFNMEKIESLERLPTASILVRIHQAPLSDDGLRVLRLADFPQSQWESLGIWVRRPLYATGAYNNSLCPARDSEKELFHLRQSRDDRPVRESAQLLLGADGINEEKNDKDLVRWLDEKITRNSNTGLIDLLYFARYRQEAGFKFSLDGIHNAPKAQPYVGIYTLNPPDGNYEDPPPGLYEENEDDSDVSKVQLNSLLDWDGPVLSPRFLDGFNTFKDIKFNKNTHIIVDIRTINLQKYPPKFEDVGWTIVPIFTPDGFVKSGIYQVPLIAGSVPRKLVKDLAMNDPWTYLMDEMKNKKSPFKLKYLKKCSICVRLVDSQREGHFNQAWDYNRIDYQYLPQKQKDLQAYAYNNTADAAAKAGKPLTSIVPNKGNPQAFNEKITKAFVEKLGMSQYGAT